MSSRIDAAFARGKAFIPYITAGDPSLAATRDFVLALAEAGADIIELGVPFSDPIADGPTNQRAAERALRAGTLVFGEDVALADRVACRLMGFDPERIPLVREAFRLARSPISSAGSESPAECRIDDRACLETDLEPVAGRAFEPTAGWRQHLRGNP